MICLWQGVISAVLWPHRDACDLEAELWWPREPENGFRWSLAKAQLRFVQYVRAEDVELYKICGPDVHVLSRDALTAKYFAEFADAAPMAVELEVRSAEFDRLLVFLVADGAHGRIAARPMNSRVRIEDLPRRVALAPEPELAEPASATSGARDAPAQPSAPHPAPLPTPLPAQSKPIAPAPLPDRPTDTKKTLQQTIMAGLRLRGIRSAHKNFKRLYYGIFNLAEIALENTDPELVTTDYIRDKVEALLAVVE